MTKFTKGPWTVGDPNDVLADIGIQGPEYIIADVCNDGYDEAIQQANAALIAASPIMYAALEPFADYPGDFFDVDDDKPVTITVLGRNLKAARAALAKAEGGVK